ncbi:hypothetical protein HBH55_226470 [Parastagonospora nodorum]|nr:hypothetical protein HBH55_226470 [Parastagonospora nodorum]
MASRRACVSVLRSSEACSSKSTCASSSLRKFSSRANGFAYPSPRANAPSPRSLISSKSPKSTLQLLQTRQFSSTPTPPPGPLDEPKPGEERKITFIDKDSQSHTFTVADGANLLDIAQAHDLEMEGACGGSCACSTCHVIVEDEGMYEKMEEPDDDENDMLDLAFGLTETSRLGCQVVMRKELDGLVVRLPRITRNLQASDFK